MQRENGNKNVGQAMPDSKGNSFWKNEIRLIIRQAEPDLRVTTTNAFTLIELLVVVLIIGILAAVAVPKYEMAVEKSRVTKAIVAVKNLSESMERYYLANGTYPRSFGYKDSLFWAELDMEMPVITDFDLFFSDQGYVGAWRFGSSRFDYVISRDLANGGEGKKFKCWTAVLNDTSRSAQLCKQLCGGAELKKAWGGTPSTGCEF